MNRLTPNLRRTLLHAVLVIPAFSAGLAAVGGCQNTDAPIEGRGERFDHPWLQLGNDELRRDTMIDNARQARIPGDLLRVSVPVRSVSDKQLYVEWRVTFFDGNGTELSHVTGTETIPSHGTRYVAANSTDPKAESFQVFLNYPRVN